VNFFDRIGFHDKILFRPSIKYNMIVNLEPQTSIAVTLNTNTHNFVFHKDKMCSPKSVSTVSLNDLRDILLNNQIEYPSYVYSEARGVYHKYHEELFVNSKIKHNLIYLPNTMLGVEFVKSHIFTSPFVNVKSPQSVKKILSASRGKVDKSAKFATILECDYGSCVVILQNRASSIDTDKGYATSVHEVSEAGIAKIKKGERVLIPSGYDYTIVNIKSSPCFVSQFYKQAFRLNYSTIKAARGMGYYIIRKNGRIEVTPNSKYKSTVKIKNIKIKEMMKAYQVDFKGSLYSNIINSKHSQDISDMLIDFTEYTKA